jgi:uncharacterized Ntn-hydrolase superfamily protein
VATQSFTDPGYGPRLLAALRAGGRAEEALKKLLEADPARELRQVAVVDAAGQAAAHTGALCIGHAGHRTGPNVSCQGNLLADGGVWEAMEQTFSKARGLLPERLMAALAAGQRAGGDARGRQSAALLVVRPAPAESPWRSRWIDLRVEDHRKPIVELARLLRLKLAHDALERAALCEQAGDLAGTRAASEEALRRSRRHDEMLFWVGLGTLRAGDEDEAVALLREALRRNRRWSAVLDQLPPVMRPSEAVLRRVRGRR